MCSVRAQNRMLAVLAGWSLAAVATASATTWNVNVANFSFSPANLTVAPGDTIHWVWVSGSHTVTSGTGCSHNTTYFDAALNSVSTTFDFVVPTGVPSIPYFCRPHCLSGMTGVITVQSTDIRQLVMTLDGNQEVPPVSTAATGSGTATLDALTGLFSWNISFSGLSAGETAAHFHGAALPCATAGPQVTLPLGSPKVGSAALTPAQVADLLAGKWYVNVHSTAFPNGEIRGQVAPAALGNPIPVPIPTGSVRVQLVPVAVGLTAPLYGTSAPGQPGQLYVVDQAGTLWRIDLATGTKTAFLDVSARLVPLGAFGPNTFDERGFLGVAFDPAYATNGRLYTFTSEPFDPNSPAADFPATVPAWTPNCQNVVAEWTVPNPADPNSLPGARRELFRLDKPQFNHNGGGLAFGPDGLLYVSIGDGGNADDQGAGHSCGGNGQNTSVVWGKILRIDPLGTNSVNGHYGIPADNPFVAGGGLPEIYAYGLRNPWRFSFDTSSGQLYCADVGQNDVEEIDVIVKGGNYGWRWKEGSFSFHFNGDQPGYVSNVPQAWPAGLIDPVAEYDHDEGTAIIGGFVYRGGALAALAGRYVFGDYARTFNNDGRLFYLDAGNAVQEFQLVGQAALGLSLLGFGQDAGGTLYALGNTTGIPFGTTGVVLRIAPPPCSGDGNCDGVINWRDIDYLVAAQNDNQTAWAALFAPGSPACGFLNLDTSGDGAVNWRDIDPFIALMNTTCP